MKSHHRVLVNMAMSDSMRGVFDARPDIKWDVITEQTESALLHQIADAHALILVLTPLTQRVIEAATELRVVSRRGVGYDNVDVAALTRAGIPLTVTGAANSVSVAEHALHLMMALAKQSHVHDRQLRHGQWDEARLLHTLDMAGRCHSLLV